MGKRSFSLLCARVSIVSFIVLGLSGNTTTCNAASSSSNIHKSTIPGDNDKCVPSSCGDLQNISYPFRLEHDPSYCGESSFTLNCDNNVTMLHLYSGKYYVKAIDYDNTTIRLVDPGLEKNNCTSLPRFPLGKYNFSLMDTYQPLNISAPPAVTFLNCAKPMNSSLYVDAAQCVKSEAYSYVMLGGTKVADLEPGCSIVWMTMISVSNPFWGKGKDQNVQDIHNQLVYGFELQYHDIVSSRAQWCLDEHTCFTRSIEGLFQILGELILYLFFLPVSSFEDDQFCIAIIANVVMVKLIFGGPFVIALLIHKWRRRHRSTYNTIEDFLHRDNFMPIRYSYSNIKKMSNGFKDKLGEGGYGSVFKGKLQSGHFGAIKLLGKSNANGEDFMSEITTIGRIHHVNVVQLVGYCVEGSKRALVYDFMPNGSLDKYIYSKQGSITLSYKKMYEIAVGVAEGIEYLHQGCEMQILHFDIKPHNILLDENFIPKISDFGLAKLYPANHSIIPSIAARGTMGYIAPELFYKNIGGVSYKADVYSFGMLLMEMASRRKNLNAHGDNSSQLYFPTWVLDQYNDGKDLEVGDATEEEKKLIKKMIVTALWCIQVKPSDRPSMKRVTQMLVADVEHPEMPPKPSLCPQPMPVSNLIPICSNVELTCTLSAR
ncbi:rust resistance kinase Lr10-like [Rosa chinensis]|uniref:rust resistance kinase Lr10-like n=1 Tax=Rosa chinensis TaxID=74649 RepID=UPI001AD8F469|nr:rust resistance kinase Lr10-like [Rosa chinensis]